MSVEFELREHGSREIDEIMGVKLMANLNSKKVQNIGVIENELILLGFRLNGVDIEAEMDFVVSGDLQIPAVDVHFDVGSAYSRDFVKEEVSVALECV